MPCRSVCVEPFSLTSLTLAEARPKATVAKMGMVSDMLKKREERIDGGKRTFIRHVWPAATSRSRSRREA